MLSIVRMGPDQTSDLRLGTIGNDSTIRSNGSSTI